MHSLRILVAVVGSCSLFFQATEIQFHRSEDPVIKAYVSAIYKNELDSDPIYLLAQPSTLFVDYKDGTENKMNYMSTGSVCPRFQVSQEESGTCMTYATYFLMHEAYLAYLLEHSEAVIFEEQQKDAATIAADVESRMLHQMPPFITKYLAPLCGDAAIFVTRHGFGYGAYPSSIVRNNNETGTQYIISPLLGEMLFERAQREVLLPGSCDDTVYLCRLFNNRSHWTPLTEEQEAYFNAHKNERNGGFLSDQQLALLLQDYLNLGVFGGLYRSTGVDLYVDISGFMTGHNNHALLVCNTNAEKPCFIMSRFLIHLIAKNQVRPYFEKLAPIVAEVVRCIHA
jgi:hypothetical protein